MYTIADIILAEINWFYFIGPIVVYIFLEINSDGGNGFDGFG
jgi:hypothetical protein